MQRAPMQRAPIRKLLVQLDRQPKKLPQRDRLRNLADLEISSILNCFETSNEWCLHRSFFFARLLRQVKAGE